MWSVIGTRPLGNISRRRIFAVLLAILMVLLASVSQSLLVQAQTTTESDKVATWQEQGIHYDGVNLNKLPTPPSEDSEFSGTACQSSAIGYASFFTFEGDSNNHAVVICFDEENKQENISANLIRFNNVSITEGDDPVAFGTPESESTVTIAAEGSPIASNSSQDEGGATRCNSEYTFGLGWAICPLTSFLASGMDQLYKVLTQFLIVAPVSTSRDTALYYMWGAMQDIANVMFILGFLIIIYSQISNIGISNYGVKRLLPRLIIAAVMVNVSFWVCAVAVDLSNILGVAIDDMFKSIRDNIPSQTNQELSGWSWSALAGLALSGGAATIGVTGAVISVVASAGGTLWFLLVGLVAVMLSALVAILVLAARQALITILVIVSPLAFVAYLLPSTEKYFERWRSLFMTMLLVFPAFSVVFGGSQLAGLAIIHNADPSSPNYFHVVILGMIVQVAPVVITPLLVKLSGSLIGKLAGIVDNPNRGIVDQTRKFAEKKSNMRKANRLWSTDPNNPNQYKYNDPLSRAGRRKALKDLHHDKLIDALEGGAEAAYNRDERSSEVYRQSGVHAMHKDIGENAAKTGLARQIAANEIYRELDLNSRYSKKEAEHTESENANYYSQLGAKPELADGTSIEGLAKDIKQLGESEKAEASHVATAERKQEESFYQSVIDNRELREYAGNVEVDGAQGAQRVLNIAEQKESEARETRITAGLKMLGRKEPDIAEERALILGNAAGAGRVAEYVGDTDTRSAAIRRFVKRAPMAEVQSLMEQVDLSSDASSDPDAAIMRSEMLEAIAERGPMYVSIAWRNEAAEGRVDPTFFKDAPGGSVQPGKGTNNMVHRFLEDGGFDAKAMATGERDDIKTIHKFIRDNKSSLSPRALNHVRNQLLIAYDPDGDWAGAMGKRDLGAGEVGDIWNEVGLPPVPDKMSYVRSIK